MPTDSNSKTEALAGRNDNGDDGDGTRGLQTDLGDAVHKSRLQHRPPGLVANPQL